MAAVWALYNDWKTGSASDGIWTFAADKNPSGFLLIVVIRILVFCFAVAMTLHEMNVIAANPIAVIEQIFIRSPNRG